MAGNGPAPAEQKRRRNKAPTFDELPAEGYQGEFPPLPASYGIEVTEKVIETDPETGEKVERWITRRRQLRYLHDTRDWYETWARSPMATRFTHVDWNRLQRIARLADAYYRRPSKDLAAELRLQEAAFGGSPLDRLRAQMKIAKPADDEPAKRAAPKSSSKRRARLSVVK